MDVSTLQSFLQQVTRCFGWYLCYILPIAGMLLLIRRHSHVPDDVFRKLLHAAAFTSAPFVMTISPSWQVAVAVLLVFGALVWPALALAERWQGFAHLLVEKSKHEIRRSMLLLFWGNALIVALCWGAFGTRPIAIAIILMWGIGDAAAALVGRRLGKHHVTIPLADPAKTWEGSAAMFMCSFAVGIASLGLSEGLSPRTLLQVAVAALLGTYVELISHGGIDTITVPFAMAAALLALR